MPSERLLNIYGMKLNERIKFARTSAGLTQADLARHCKVSRAAVNGWESGNVKNLRNAHLFSVSKATGFAPEWLATEKGPKRSVTSPAARSEIEWLGPMDAWDSQTPLNDDEVELPLFREVELAAGSGRTEVIENHGAKLRFAKSTLRRAGVDSANAGCAFVKGNSMERIIPDGATIGVDKGSVTVKDGEIYAIDHDGMLRVKYLYRQPGGGLKLTSENEAEHPPEIYTAAQVQEMIRVIGRVFWWSVLR